MPTPSYSHTPGPMETQMVEGVMVDLGFDPEVKERFEKMKSEKTILQPNQTAAKLVKILFEDSFESGQHVDYYDVE